MTRSENEVDQIVFRWDSENASGSTGFGPVAWSGPREEAEALFRISGPMLRASGAETRPALIRLQQRAGVMLIRRTPFTDADGGTSVLCHALVGSPALLDPAVCLGLHAWNWEGAALDAAVARCEEKPPRIRREGEQMFYAAIKIGLMPSAASDPSRPAASSLRCSRSPSPPAIRHAPEQRRPCRSRRR